VIRETTFVPSVHGMACIGTALLTGGRLLSDIDPFGASPFLIGVISFLLIRLLLLIADLDNPFAAGEALPVVNVSRLPLTLAADRLRRAEEAG
jgi:hypothetical protein